MDYIVDMRIPFSEEDLAAPKQIYSFFKEHNATDYFRFHTGNISDHDLKVQRETDAIILTKCLDKEKINPFTLKLLQLNYRYSN